MRVNVKSHARRDCPRLSRAVSSVSSPLSASGNYGEESDDDDDVDDPCAAALEELARGIASLADGPQRGVEDAFVRIVFASNYRANDPPFHTDKAPLRGYVTLTGPGTEYMDRISSPAEYAALRFGGLGGGLGGEPGGSVRTAEEMEFIVMKGDNYEAPTITAAAGGAGIALPPADLASRLTKTLWRRTSACVHRSPPQRADMTTTTAATAGGGRQ